MLSARVKALVLVSTGAALGAGASGRTASPGALEDEGLATAGSPADLTVTELNRTPA